MSDLEETLAFQLKALGIPFDREKALIPGRRFRWDFVLPNRLAVEVDGATWTGGRHVRGAGVESDAEKGALAAVAGYRTIRCTGAQVTDGRCLAWIEQALA